MSPEYCDLHCHTTASDGSFSPAELVRYARARNAAAIAVTDHDTTAGLDEALAEGRACSLRVIPGIEITTSLDGCEVHIVGLFIDHNNSGLQAAVKQFAATRDQRNYDMVQKLMDAGFHISHEDMERFAGCVITKAHVAQILVERGYAENTKEAMDNFLRRGGPAYTPRIVPPPEQALELIHRSGGLAFVAHTNQIDKKDRDHSVSLCERLLALGADGLETRYSEFDEDWRHRTEALAVQYDALRSGGSDFHGSYKKGLDLLTGYGDLFVPYTFVRAMDAYRAKQDHTSR